MRRYPAALLLLFCLFFLTSPLAAQLSPPPAPQPVVTGRDPQAMSVLTNALSAMGGTGAASIQDTVVQATFTAPPNAGGQSGTVTVTTKGATEMRSDSTLGSKSTSIIFNNGIEKHSGEKGWVTLPAANAHHKRIEHLPAMLLYYELARSDMAAAYVGQESLNGESVHHLRLARTSNTGNSYFDQIETRNSQIEIYVDAQTLQIARISFIYLSSTDWRRGFPMDIYYDRYRTVNGIAVPFHQRYFFAGSPNGEFQLTSVVVNQGPTDSIFKGN